MFEHYGFLDALCAVKKYIVWIVLCAVLVGALGVGVAKAKNDAMHDENYAAEKQSEVIVSEYYLISGTMNADSDKNQLQYNRDLALAISAMINADYTRQSVFDVVIGEFEVDALMGTRSEIRNKYSDKVLTNQLIGEFVTVAVLPDSSILKIVVNTENEKISERILELYRERFTATVEQLRSTAIDVSYSSVAETKIGTDSESSHSPVSGGVSTKKYVLIFAVLGGVIAVCAAFAWTLFFPVINRRSDVEGYNIRVISDKKESMDFVINNIVRCRGETDEAVAFVICKGAADKKKGKSFFESLKQKSEGQMDLVMCYDAASDYEEYKKAAKCACAIVAVSYMNTKHTEYQKTIARLQENGIEILGTVVV